MKALLALQAFLSVVCSGTLWFIAAMVVGSGFKFKDNKDRVMTFSIITALVVIVCLCEGGIGRGIGFILLFPFKILGVAVGMGWE